MNSDIARLGTCDTNAFSEHSVSALHDGRLLANEKSIYTEHEGRYITLLFLHEIYDAYVFEDNDIHVHTAVLHLFL